MSIKHLAARVLTPGLRRFSNLHKGESCYVFGDGPSIKWFDLGLFNDRPAICCGMIPFHKDFPKLNVKYITCVEPWLFAPKLLQRHEYLRELRDIATEYKKLVHNTPDREFFVSLSNIFSLSGKNVNYVFRGLPRNINRTDELLGEFDLFAGSFHASLALAYYLGFSTIYLVGFDAWTIQPVRNMRWYELGEGDLSDTRNLATEFLEILKREVDIYTISFDGQSKNVKNISYQTYTGKSPSFKENHEIMDEYHLRVMASFPKYNIYPDEAKRSAAG